MKLSKEKEHMELNPYTLWLLELYFIFNSTNLNLLFSYGGIAIVFKATNRNYTIIFITYNESSVIPKPNVDEIKSLAIKHGADMIVIDQLSLMSDKRRADIPRIAYNNISEDLFLMSKELKKPVLLMAQANREAVKNRKKGESPELHDLAESDGVGQNATRVLSLSVIDGTLKISVKKNRYGINNKEVLMIWEVNTGYLKPLLSENPEDSTEDKKDDKPDGEKDKGGEKDYGF